MDRLFLDANVLFSAAYRDDAGVRRLWSPPDAELVTSAYAVEEARRNLPEPDQRDRLEALLGGMDRVTASGLAPDARADIELPEKDWPILAGALAARATHLITGDVTHFGPYFGRTIYGVRVMRPGVYLRSCG